jgi:hypothetical protein
MAGGLLLLGIITTITFVGVVLGASGVVVAEEGEAEVHMMDFWAGTIIMEEAMLVEEEVDVGIATGTDCLCMVVVVEGDGQCQWPGRTRGSETSMNKKCCHLSNRNHSAGWMMVVKMFQ